MRALGIPIGVALCTMANPSVKELSPSRFEMTLRICGVHRREVRDLSEYLEDLLLVDDLASGPGRDGGDLRV